MTFDELRQTSSVKHGSESEKLLKLLFCLLGNTEISYVATKWQFDLKNKIFKQYNLL